MSRADPAPTYPEIIFGLISALETGDFKQARMSLDPSAASVSELSRRFFLDMQTTNTKETRGRTDMRLSHTVQVSFWVPTRHGPVSDVLAEALATEQHILDRLLDRSLHLWVAEYQGTRRALNGTREILQVTVTFTLKAYHRAVY